MPKSQRTLFVANRTEFIANEFFDIAIILR